MALPEFVPPMLAKIGEAFSSDDHLFEIKWDGTRAITLAEGGDFRLFNRKQRAIRETYPEMEFLAGLPSGTVLDGEIVILKDGKPDFTGMLRREQALHPRRVRTMMSQLPATYVVFDLLYRDGEPITDWKLTERREALQEVLSSSISDPRAVFSDGIVGDGRTFFEHACEQELEGIMAKRLESRYLPGRRSDSWLKIKRRQRMPCAVIGYLPKGKRDLKSLLIAREVGGELVYAGKVGSGLDDVTRARLVEELESRTRDSPLVPARIEARWVEPGLYCTVEFLEVTENGELRAPVFVDWTTG